MFSMVIYWWLGGTTNYYGFANESELVNIIDETPFGHVKKFEVFKRDELIATFDEFGNMI